MSLTAQQLTKTSNKQKKRKEKVTGCSYRIAQHNTGGTIRFTNNKPTRKCAHYNGAPHRGELRHRRARSQACTHMHTCCQHSQSAQMEEAKKKKKKKKRRELACFLKASNHFPCGTLLTNSYEYKKEVMLVTQMMNPNII